MSAFDEAFSLSDEALLAEMPSRVRINGFEMDCAETAEGRDNVQAEGGAAAGLGLRLLVRGADFTAAAGRVGARVEFGDGFLKRGVIGAFAVLGATVSLSCVASSGRAADF